MAKPKITPVGGNILVQPTSSDTTTPSGIVLPDTIDKDKPQRGKVVALGTGAVDSNGKKIAFNVKENDEVLFKKYSPEELEIEGEDYLIMTEDAILAILK